MNLLKGHVHTAQAPVFNCRLSSGSGHIHEPSQRLAREVSRPPPCMHQSSPQRASQVVTRATGVPGGSAALEKQIEDLTIDLSKFTCEFFRVEAIIRPWRLQNVVKALSARGIVGMTACQVRGAGVQGGKKERYSGVEHGIEDLVDKSKIDIVVQRDQVDSVVRTITKAAQTGEVGDGKIFVLPVADIVRIRTTETGTDAEKMEGGMSDRQSNGASA
ncbi:hypothetical protein CVIRNUC_000042 [Coccomyxa viridis]|uniref:Nitrogen regulatory protein P-II n=1 Tax=Coccomyxa viridis TaxID=1274662 RepID=A0AAV1HP51_9CHLO|nr:hypothetical protein CVIRNUC_000042 [Coccomyxa viridis]